MQRCVFSTACYEIARRRCCDRKASSAWLEWILGVFRIRMYLASGFWSEASGRWVYCSWDGRVCECLRAETVFQSAQRVSTAINWKYLCCLYTCGSDVWICRDILACYLMVLCLLRDGETSVLLLSFSLPSDRQWNVSMDSLTNKCRKFEANIFNKSKCQNCFKGKEDHSAEALESNRVHTYFPRNHSSVVLIIGDGFSEGIE